MYYQLERYINLNIPIAGDKLDEIVKHFKPISTKRNSILLSQGDVCSKLYFVNKGVIRTYYITEQGSEKSRFVAFEGMIAGALSSFISREPSFEFVGALEDCDLLYITHSDFHKLVNEYPEWEKFYLKLLEFAYIYQNKRIEQLTTLSAGERYTILMKEYPEYIQRLSNKILASLLDVTQETLSRLKSK